MSTQNGGTPQHTRESRRGPYDLTPQQRADLISKLYEVLPTTAEVRERFIDGFPMDTWAVSRAECGQDFDRWLAAHDAQVLHDAAERLNEECQNLPRWPGRTHDMTKVGNFVAGVLDSRLFLHGLADQAGSTGTQNEGEL